jgi:Tol biopolymer transport system component
MRTLKSRLVYWVFGAVTLLLASHVKADFLLYGTTWGDGETPSTLVQLDPSTGQLIQTIGSVGYAVNGLDWDPGSGVLYGTTSVNDASYTGLISIDTTTGAGTPVGTGWGTLPDFNLTVVAMTIDSGGNAFGWLEPNSEDLVSIDTGAGTISTIGDSGVSTSGQGLSFDTSDTLFLVVNNGLPDVYTVNVATGATTFLGTVADATASWAHHGDFNPDNGLYYGIRETLGTPSSLVLIDMSGLTQTGTLTTDIDELHTLAFVGIIPEPSSLWLLSLGALLAVSARRRAARRRAQAV